MKKKTIGILIKIAIILLALSGLLCLVMMRRILDYMLPGFSGMTHRMWLMALYTCAIPCFAALVPAWLIAGNIGTNKSFCKENAHYTKWVGILMSVDTVLIAAANAGLFVLGRSFFALFISFSLIIAIFLSISICAFALSSLLDNATVLQNQSDFTI